MVGQLPLEQHIGVRIPGGQPTYRFKGFVSVRLSPVYFLQVIDSNANMVRNGPPWSAQRHLILGVQMGVRYCFGPSALGVCLCHLGV